jgi:hypothetical protein
LEAKKKGLAVDSQELEFLLNKIIDAKFSAFKAEMEKFWVGPELHYQDHIFLHEWKRTVEKSKSFCNTAILASLISGIIALFIIGIKQFLKGL